MNPPDLRKKKVCWWEELKREVPAVRKLPSVIMALKQPKRANIEKAIRSLPKLEDKLREFGLC